MVQLSIKNTSLNNATNTVQALATIPCIGGARAMVALSIPCRDLQRLRRAPMPRKDPEARRAYNAALYQKQRPARLAARAAYRATYPDKVRASKAAARLKHRPKVLERMRAWYQGHRE